MDVDIDELAKTFSEYTDEKLLSMASSGDLTDFATKVLEKELSQRGISFPQPKEGNDERRKVKTNRLAIVSAISGASIIVVIYVLGTILETYPQPQPGISPIYHPDALPVIVGATIAVLLLMLLAIIAGLVALYQIKKREENKRSYVLAIAGILIGFVPLVMLVLGIGE